MHLNNLTGVSFSNWSFFLKTQGRAKKSRGGGQCLPKGGGGAVKNPECDLNNAS